MSHYKTIKNVVRPLYEHIWKIWLRCTDKPSGHYPVIIQGIQRSGTNYLTTLLTQSDYRIINRIDPKRNDPRHKHFRWQQDKSSIVMDNRYQNSLYAASLEEINKICGYPVDLKHIVLFRTPENWLNSIYRWGLESKWFENEDDFFSRKLHITYLQEWDAYYSFWQSIAAHTPHQVLLMNYERLIEESNRGIAQIELFMGVKRNPSENLQYSVEKVRHSRPISEKRTSLERPELTILFKQSTIFDWRTAMENSL
jgi:hypothetical protein